MKRQRSQLDDFEDTAITLLRVHPRSILVSYEGLETWLPTALCDHRARGLRTSDAHRPFEIGIRLWKVIELGWLPPLSKPILTMKGDLLPDIATE
jgi:hypothetical protein